MNWISEGKTLDLDIWEQNFWIGFLGQNFCAGSLRTTLLSWISGGQNFVWCLWAEILSWVFWVQIFKLDLWRWNFWVRSPRAKLFDLDLIQILVSVLSHYSQTFFCGFPGIFIEKTTFEEFEDICEQIYKEFKIMMKNK